MVAMDQTVTVINKSGKVVKSSKHLVNIFNEAKSAYNERKAELKAFRRNQQVSKDDESKTRRKVEDLTVDESDTRSRHSSRRNSEDERSDRRKKRSKQQRPTAERGVSDSFYTNDHYADTRPGLPRRHSSTYRQSTLRRESLPNPSPTYDPTPSGLSRRNTDGLELERHHQEADRRHGPVRRRASLDDIDMDLAYGELPPPLPERKYDDEVALRSKMSGLQVLLDECNCMQHSVTAIIDHLQKNPDALAAVALSLGEISSLVSKVAPGALAGMKGSFPAIVALLASSEFAIAAGVGVGVTIIAFGGYKIIKKIQAKREIAGAEGDSGNVFDAGVSPSSGDKEQVEEIRELDRIEVWRRGIADVEADSLGTSVDGELITPRASRTLIEEGRLTEADLKSRNGSEGGRTKGSKRKEKSSQSTRGSKQGGASKSKSSTKKEPSGLRMLFKGSSS